MGEVDKAFRAVPRKYFVLPADISRAHLDQPLPIGFGQTISQPYTVQKMLEWLDIRPGQRILDVGSGSGWTSALLEHLAGPGGRVTAIELVPELVRFGRINCEKFGCQNVEFHQAGEIYGWPETAPYDRILVSASADTIPPELLDQLVPGGKLVIPVHHTILEITKHPRDLKITEHPGFVFVLLLPG